MYVDHITEVSEMVTDCSHNSLDKGLSVATDCSHNGKGRIDQISCNE